MNLKQIERASKLLAEVKTLDAEIIELDRYALLIANGEVSINLELGVTDLSKKKEDESKVQFDEDGSIVKDPSKYFRGLMHYVTYDFGSGCIKPKEEASQQTLKASIQENAALQILGVLLCVKQEKRTELLTRIEKLGAAL